MLIRRVKAAIKSRPLLYKLVHPLLTVYLRARTRQCRRQFARFRRYCQDLSDRVPGAVFAKIGANDGIMDDPCSDILLRDPRWKGLLIEPLPHCFERLKANFSDSDRFSLECVAIGARAGEAPFYYVAPQAFDDIPNLAPELDGLGSLNRNHIPNEMESLDFRKWKERLEPYGTQLRLRLLRSQERGQEMVSASQECWGRELIHPSIYRGRTTATCCM